MVLCPRWRRPLGFLAVACLAALGLFWPASAALAANTKATTVSIPATLDFTDLYAAGSTVRLSGTTTLAGDRGVACVTALLDQSDMSISRVVEPRCDDPQLENAVVMPVVSGVPGMVGYASASIARLDPDSGEITVGRALMTYQETSGSQLQSADGPGVMWLYDEGNEKGPTVIRLSDKTGQVLQVTRIPELSRPIITADADGLYLAPASNSFGFPGNGVIYFVGLGARTAAIVHSSPEFNNAGGFAAWMIGDGHDLWADLCTRQVATCTIWRFTGANLAPVWHVTNRGGTGGWIAGNATEGFFTTAIAAYAGAAETSANSAIVRIDPATGAITAFAPIPLPPFWNDIGGPNGTEALVVDHALYLLAPPEQNQPGALYRIAVP